MSGDLAPSPIGFLPLLRHGDLLFTAIVLRHHTAACTRKGDAVLDVRGRRCSLPTCVCSDVTEAGPRLFGRSGVQLDILLSHTILGVYARAASRDCLRQWPKEFTERTFRRSIRQLGISWRKHRELSSVTLRWCHSCVEADIEGQGFAAWRVLHQIESLDRCPYHGDPLRNGASLSIKSDVPWPLYLPSDNVQFEETRTHESIPMSEGYGSYLKLWPRLLDGHLQIVTPEYWWDVVSQIVDKTGSVASAGRRLRKYIEASWGRSIDEISARLSIKGGASFIEDELRLRSQPIHIARRLVLYSAATAMGLLSDALVQLELTFAPFQLTVASVTQPECATELLNISIAAGLPIASAPALLKYPGINLAAGAAHVTPEALRGFVHELPDELLSRLSVRFRELRQRSWLASELRRRAA